VGFVSEWFLLESLMQQFRVGRLVYALPLAVAGALVAITAGFAAVAFVRIVGLTVLGPRQRADVVRDRDVGPLGTAGLALLVMGCVGWPRSLRCGSGRSSLGSIPSCDATWQLGRSHQTGCCNRCTPSSPRCRRPGSPW